MHEQNEKPNKETEIKKNNETKMLELKNTMNAMKKCNSINSGMGQAERKSIC